MPGDKSISHRALIFAAFAKGTCRIEGLSPAADCVSTADCLTSLGLQIKRPPHSPGTAIVTSPGLDGLHEPRKSLDCGNSGTTMRLLAGLCAGRPFTSKFQGDPSLSKRPMLRVLDPLGQMGAKIEYKDETGLAPFQIKGGNLSGRDFALTVPSAQVQTALLLAGLQASGKTKVILPSIVRDHTQRMFQSVRIPYSINGGLSITVKKLEAPLEPFEVTVPADISSSAFFMVAAALLPESDVLLTDVGVNPGRTLVIEVLKRMGADITVEHRGQDAGEPIADVRVKWNGRLKGATVGGDEIATGIDEIPILALAGCFCDGEFVVKNAGELRHKESDRLKAIVVNLSLAGANIREKEDGFVIQGQASIAGGSQWGTHNDHRLAMSGYIASLVFDQPVSIEEKDSIAISYPGFAADLDWLTKGEVSMSTD